MYLATRLPQSLRPTVIAIAVAATLSACANLPGVGAVTATPSAVPAVAAATPAVATPAAAATPATPATPAAAAVAAAKAAAVNAARASAIAQPAPDGAAPAAPGATPPAPGMPPAGAAPGQPRPFKDVIKDAKETPGFFTVWEKDDKVWLEVKPEQLDQPFYFTVNITDSLGERGLYASQMGRRNNIVYFRKIGNNLQMVAKNYRFRAKDGTAMAHTVSQGFAESLISAAPVVSMPHPEKKTFLIDANALLVKDIPMYATALDNAFRLGYAFDAPQSHFTKVRAAPQQLSFNVNAHFSIPKLPSPPLTPSPVPTPTPPENLRDVRSMFIGYHYSLAALPATPMAPRVADARIGHFTTSFSDFSDDTTPTPRKHFVNRWRLEKKDPAAAISEPKEPITFWLDKNIPEKYRAAVTAGILEWNKAFERIGFKNAVVAKQQTDKDDFDTLDVRHASVRWFVGSDVGFAIGPSDVDPRTGEILDADIGMSDVFGRGARRIRAEDVGRPAITHAFGQAHDHSLCTYAHDAAAEFEFATDLLELRGDLPWDSPEVEALAQAVVKDTIVHEVGHTLGLRHNFRSSMIYSLAQLSDPEFGKQNNLTGSVMDYTPYNIAKSGEKQGQYVNSTLGPYDYWAVEYAYKPIDPASEKAELEKILARSTEPLLAYATDEDAGFGPVEGMDPEVNRFDLGNDPLAYMRKRIELSRELWDRLQSKQLRSDENYSRLRRSFMAGFQPITRAAPAAAKYVGGMTFLRDNPGTGRLPFTPVAAEKQREALNLLARTLFTVDSFRFQPEFLSKLGPDHYERAQSNDLSAAINPNVSVATMVFRTQTGILNQLMSESVAQRIVDSSSYVPAGKSAFKLSELYDTLQNAIWSELASRSEIDPLRRNLQIEHAKKVANSVLRPSANAVSDIRSLQRVNARTLLANIRGAMTNAKLSKESKAHLAECEDLLKEALAANMQRGV